ncbi:HAD superfamily hydrolase (TIGR01509 family) [Propionibacteriaceae bacterium ES.041]|uniref:HAD family hydrolase n=1 Tax=Enemella evansiae TaxID=2016499 RepID=UPI000B96E3CD|nr:HAD family phosphatase [Enemella evansiae]PFG68529.1 HAD superfamily hydrolase (TIGR01509 family) [Propionibacteriaceae bacterium ES.041]OYO01704.1 HAD family hydrolase [Enemella evansiae]OYO09974.1 HAD family hydrolase [Enemella evansiae]OYO18846.1 HAD family hydrolase [Enemella evansiae]TDO87569.1 HAD superfamily hydrolase (TIGR01509 family) [Enemella evansiae]
MDVAAVVFDLDGTLIDTEHLWDEVRRGLAAADGRDWPADATSAMLGMSTPEWSRYLAETVGVRGTPEEVAKRTIDGMLEHYHRGLPVLPGAVDAVRRMHAATGLLGAATSSPRVLLDAALAELGVTELFSATVSTEEVAAGKPAPDGYAECCRRLGVEPQRAVAVEDSANGIRSALNAGMAVVAIPPHFHPPPADVLARASAVLDDLDGLTGGLLAELPTPGTAA